jgi:hypothetical protein
MYNWEELGKMDSSILRTLRNITFGDYSYSSDGDFYTGNEKVLAGENIYDRDYPMVDTDSKQKLVEEWPSERFNYQDNYKKQNLKQSDIVEFLGE